jgi:hypothetical protein
MFFSKTKTPSTTDKPINPPINIGEHFRYLGIDMICVRHCSYPHRHKLIVAEYADKNGILRSTIFHPADWDALQSDMNRSKTEDLT